MLFSALESLLPLQHDNFLSKQWPLLWSILYAEETDPSFLFLHLASYFPDEPILWLSLGKSSTLYYRPLLERFLPSQIPFVNFIDLSESSLDNFNLALENLNRGLPTSSAASCKVLLIDDFFLFSSFYHHDLNLIRKSIASFSCKNIPMIVGCPHKIMPDPLLHLPLYASQIIFTLSPLAFSRSKNVDGILTFTEGPMLLPLYDNITLKIPHEEVHYKLAEITDSKFWFKGSISSRTY